MNKIRISITLALAAANALMWGSIIRRSKEAKQIIRIERTIRTGSPGLHELEI